MRIVIFGLTVSSSWGNGHAVLWRGLLRELAAEGHHITFFEHDQPYYAQNRDLSVFPWGGELVLYTDWDALRPRRMPALMAADVAIVTSYCADGVAATQAVMDAPVGVRCFYDMDTPVTLARLAAGEGVEYIGADGLSGFDIVFSYTGGRALDALRTQLGARHVAPLYGWVDPNQYVPATPRAAYAGVLSYIGTYAADRQAALE
ncbi:MAG: glycosyltransferase, partial [Acetobacteraceae bacterium]|nr:glycosyltransferase [Acetobacteraceae bacterium]